MPESRIQLAPGLALVLATALAVRLAAVLWLAETIPYSDYFYYHEAGRLQALDWRFLLRHDTVVHYGKLNWWPPGYPLFLAAIYALFGPQFRVAVFVQVILGTLVVALVYAIGARAAGRRAGLAAAWLVALNPTYVFTTNLVASENLFVVWLALGLWFAGRAWSEASLGVTPARRTRAADPSSSSSATSPRRAAAFAGAALALATLTRAVALFTPFVVAAWLRRRAPHRAAGNVTAAWLLGAFALVLAPWTVRNAVVAGTPVLVCFGGGLNFYFGHNEGPLGYREVAKTPLAGAGDAAAIDRRGYALGLRYLAAHPFGFVTRGVRKIGALFAPPTAALHANSAILLPDARADPSLAGLAAAKRARQAVKDALLHGVLKVLAALHSYILLAGALVASTWGWRRLPQELRLAACVTAAWIVVHVLFWAQPRFRYPMEVPMALLAGWTIDRWLLEPRASGAERS